MFSDQFDIVCGVLLGSVLSPFFFNIYVDDLIIDLESSVLGCRIGNQFLGCVMYADDLLLISASVPGPQPMLDICYEYGRKDFYSKKSHCCVFGSSSRTVSLVN